MSTRQCCRDVHRQAISVCRDTYRCSACSCACSFFPIRRGASEAAQSLTRDNHPPDLKKKSNNPRQDARKWNPNSEQSEVRPHGVQSTPALAPHPLACSKKQEDIPPIQALHGTGSRWTGELVQGGEINHSFTPLPPATCTDLPPTVPGPFRVPLLPNARWRPDVWCTGDHTDRTGHVGAECAGRLQ